MIKDLVYVKEIVGYQIDEDIMLCLALGGAQIPFRNVIRQPIGAISLNDIRAMHCKAGTREQPSKKASYLFGPKF